MMEPKRTHTECGPTCHANCKPLPTYEQRYAVGVFFYDADAHLSGSDIEKLAQLIANREHSLRVELDTARARIAELEAKLEQK